MSVVHQHACCFFLGPGTCSPCATGGVFDDIGACVGAQHRLLASGRLGPVIQDSMTYPDRSLSHEPERLAGCWHCVPPLELQRLVLEGATIVLDMSTPLQPELLGSSAVVEENAIIPTCSGRVADRDVPLVCLTPAWRPAPGLAKRLFQMGYRHVFTANSSMVGRNIGDVQLS